MQPLRRILLRDNAITIGFAPEWGGALTRFDVCVGNKLIDLLRPAIDDPVGPIHALGSSCFPLVPYGGRLRNGRFRFAGKTFQYPLNAVPERHSSHGDGWTRSWSLIHLDRRSAIMALSVDESAPLKYQCTQSITVNGNRVRIALIARNCDTNPIPIGLGLHPYFANRAEATITAVLPAHRRWDQELMPTTYERNLLSNSFRRGRSVVDLPVAAEYAEWDGRAVIDWPASGVRLDLITTPRLEHVVMWLPVSKEFFCFEPISHATDAFNTNHNPTSGADFAVIEPRGSLEQCFDFTISIY